jgi:hypothetical protein
VVVVPVRKDGYAAKPSRRSDEYALQTSSANQTDERRTLFTFAKVLKQNLPSATAISKNPPSPSKNTPKIHSKILPKNLQKSKRSPKNAEKIQGDL